MTELKMIAGLGNPGPHYAANRHNVGFMLLDRLAESYSLAFNRQQFRAHIAPGLMAGHRVLLAKPLTFMNLSGSAVGALFRFYKLEPARLMVVFDDLDLPLGKLRLRAGGGSGGHKGMQSIIERLGFDSFPRMRIGVGRPSHGDAADYVLTNFSADEQIEVERTFQRAQEAILTWLEKGIDEAMNQHNREVVSEG